MATEYEQRKKAFLKDLHNAIDKAWLRMGQGDENRFHLYYLPGGEDFESFSEMDQVPDGYVRVTDKEISGFKTLDQLYAWAQNLVGSVPYYSTNPKPTSSAGEEIHQKARKRTRASGKYTKREIAQLQNLDPILFGIAKGPWALEWANREEEKGQSFSGQDIYPQAPNPPNNAVTWASDIAAQLKRLNNVSSLEDLFNKAVSLGYDKNAEDFGVHLGCQAAGHGISWADDLDSGSYDQIAVPSREFYV
jgi:hypothetical protein